MADNAANFRRYVDELNKRNFSILDSVIADTVVFGPDETVTRDAYRKQILDRIDRLPDYCVTIDELWTEGDEVCIRWTHRGTDPVSGKETVGHAASAYRFANGRVVEVRSLDV